MARVRALRPERPWLAALRSLVPRLRLITVGVRALVLYQGKVVLVRHRFHDRDRWYLPGGGVDNGEDAAQAALREAEEEAGIPRASMRLRGVQGVFLNELTAWDDHVLVFVAEASEPPNTRPLAWETVEARAFAFDGLPALSPATERRLKEFRDSKQPVYTGSW
jgi:8-oxo-dGTP pyrophosphatase MutT (NUDIX family)